MEQGRKVNLGIYHMVVSGGSNLGANSPLGNIV